jgi:hypothetical protein
MSTFPDPARFARAIVLESAEIPHDMTIAQWRRAKQAALREERGARRWTRRRPRRLLRLS